MKIQPMWAKFLHADRRTGRHDEVNSFFFFFFFFLYFKKYCTTEQATKDNTAHAHCMLDTWGYKYTHSSCVILTYSMVQSPWEANSLQLVKKFPAFHGTRRFITALTSVRHLSLSWASPIQSIYPHPTSRRSVIILSTHLRCISHCFSTTTMVTRTRLTVTLYEHCLSCYSHIFLLFPYWVLLHNYQSIKYLRW